MDSARLRKFQVWFENSKEYHHLKREIFGEDVYYVELSKKDPVIIDVGAHIGLATMYFKMLYPKAKMTALEPNPNNFNLLKKNLFENRMEDVIVLPVAVGNEEGEREFFVDSSGEKWFSSGSFSEKSWNEGQNNNKIFVKVVRLSELINDPVDLIKIDIEGAEKEVLFEIEHKLNKVGMILFEYHPKRREGAEGIENLFERNGFKLNFYKYGRNVDWRKAKGLLMGEAINQR
ncbi:FkbM family methyltransferase [Patescibacteria group bacterium]